MKASNQDPGADRADAGHAVLIDRSLADTEVNSVALTTEEEGIAMLIGAHEDFLVIAGLAGASRDMAAMTGDAGHLFTMAGTMGAACMTGFGLALARPERQVLVVTGDAELLMNLGSLATIAAHNPPNLSILCVDNGRFGETGYQRSHTSFGTDLEAIAAGAGITATRTVESEGDVEAASKLLRERNGTCFVLLRVAPIDPPGVKRLLDPAACRLRFRRALLGHP